MAHEIEHPHDRLFRAVFSKAEEATGFLREVLPEEVARHVDWKSLRLVDGTFIDAALRESESDLLYEAGLGDGRERLRLHLLFEHQSTPDRWMRFRLLKYCCRIWDRERRDEPGRMDLSPIQPLVFYQGRDRWVHSTEFADVFPAVAQGWRCVPRFEHALLDETGMEPERVVGRELGRMAQLLMMVTYGRHAKTALEAAARLGAALVSSGAASEFEIVMAYLTATQEKAVVDRFAESLRLHGSKQGKEAIMSYAQELLEQGRAEGKEEARAEARSYAQELLEQGRAEGREEGRAEGREEGRAEGREEGRAAYARELLEQGRAEGREEARAEARSYAQELLEQRRAEGIQRVMVETADRLLEAGAGWDLIKKATGLDEPDFRALKERLAVDEGRGGEST